MSRTIDPTAMSAAQLLQGFLISESEKLDQLIGVAVRRQTADLPEEARKEVDTANNMSVGFQAGSRQIITRLIAERLEENRRKTTPLIGLEDVAEVVRFTLDGLSPRSTTLDAVGVVYVRRAARDGIIGLVEFLDAIGTDHCRAVWSVQHAILTVSVAQNLMPKVVIDDPKHRAAVIRDLMVRSTWDEYVTNLLKRLKRTTGTEQVERIAEAEGRNISPKALEKMKAQMAPFMAELVRVSTSYYEERTAEIWANQAT